MGPISVTLDYKVDKNILLRVFGLHMHYRGKCARVFLKRPGEKNKSLIISFPTYQYKNQTSSVFKDPISIPKGSIITTDIIYDNSEFNLTNPDPSIDLRIGTSVVLNKNYLPRFLYMEIK